MKTQAPTRVLGATLFALTLGGCLGSGGAVNARWRIVELTTGRFEDPRDIANSEGVCCEPFSGQAACSGAPAWRIESVRVQLSDPTTGVELSSLPSGLTANCGAREFTTPFTLPSGLFAIDLIADSPIVLSPSPEIRTIEPGQIVNLDVIALSIPATVP